MSDNAQSTARGIEFITLADLQNVSDRVIPFGPIGEIVDIRTYRRWLPDAKRRETALERWQRVINYNLNLVADIRPYDELRAEALLMLDKYVALQADVSGRTKWVGGTDAADRNPASQFNCSGLAVNRLDAFADAFNLLMLGVGVGFRVHQQDVNQLPGIFWPGVGIEFKDYTPVPASYRQENTAVSSIGNRVVDIGVGDSRQGWVDAVMHYLEIVTRSGKWADVDLPDHIIFNFDSVRPQGERLNGFGGTASGYQALQGIITDVQRIILECPTDRLRSIDCMDIMCAIAKGVVAGSSRRSAMICLFEDGDELCANAKVGLYTNPDMAHKSYRCQSNNTCQLGEKPSIERLRQLLDTCRTEGEPGFNNYRSMISRRRVAAKLWRPDQPFDKYTDVVTNPCFPAGTLVLTRDGHRQIETLVGQTVDVWDGLNWVTVDNFRITGNDQPVYTITLNSGQTVTATPYHTFILEDGTRKELRHLCVGDRLLTHDVVLPGSSQTLDSAYLKGFLLGDGTSCQGKPILSLYQPKFVCKDRLLRSASETTASKSYGYNDVQTPGFTGSTDQSRIQMQGLTVRREMLISYTTDYRHNGLPIESLNWSLPSKCDFVAGLFDADGTALETANGFMYQLTSIYPTFLKTVQLLLRSMGVKSRFACHSIRQYQDFESRGGVSRVQNAYQLTLSQTAAIKLASMVTFERLTSFANKTTAYKLKNREAIVTSIEFTDIVGDVYCCTVPTNNSFALTCGVMVGNCHEIILSAGLDGKSGSFCNLTTLPLPNFIITHHGAVVINFPALESAIRLNVRTSLRQTCVDIGMDGWAETQLDERLLGVSITGAQDAFALLGWKTESLEVEDFLKYCRYVANEEATEYATKLGVPRPLLVTTIKPEGTGSQVFGCTNGLHWDWSPYYIRRVRMTANDALAQTLMDQGFPCYPEIYDLSKKFPDITDPWEQIKAFDQRTTVEKRDILSACNTVVFEFPVKSYSDRTQADVGAIEKLENVKAFTVNYCDHMPSSTITVKDGEWDAVAEWIHENWDSYITASFFPYSDAKYPLPPYEAITEQHYNLLTRNIPEHSKRVLENGRITYTVDEDRLNWYERKLEDPDDVILSSSGSCPIR